MMKKIQVAAAVALALSSVSFAQQAVQWKVSDGGNGHWYGLLTRTSPLGWHEAKGLAENVGGHLACIADAAEWSFARTVADHAPAWNGEHGPWLGAFQDLGASDFSEPAGGWRWVTNEPFGFTNWWSYGPQPSNYCDGNPENYMHVIIRAEMAWNDIGEATSCSIDPVRSALIEWSADCNQDGIVDYGQILSGQLSDSDNDGIPNICECACDVVRDLNVNGIDLGVLLGQWGPANQFTLTDFNQDGSVDGVDLGILLGAWGPCPN